MFLDPGVLIMEPFVCLLLLQNSSLITIVGNAGKMAAELLKLKQLFFSGKLIATDTSSICVLDRPVESLFPQLFVQRGCGQACAPMASPF